MVIWPVLAMAFGGAASAGPALTFAPTVDVVGGPDLGARPGLTFGYEPVPDAAVELRGDLSPDLAWDAGLSLAGRWWVSPADLKGQGIFLVGRFSAGASGFDGEIGPWTGLFGGFGLRPVPALTIEATVGPDWVVAERARWRTGLTIGWVLDTDLLRDRPGQGSQRHRPRRIPEG